MTKSEFTALKVGAFVYLPPPRWSPDRSDCREVTKIDRLFGKISVIAASKPYSYRYIRLKPRTNEKMGSIMGVCKPFASRTSFSSFFPIL